MKTFIPLIQSLVIWLGFVVNGMCDGLIVVRPPHPSEGRMVVPPGHFSFAPLGVNYHRVAVDIDGMVATTTVEQEFENMNSMRLEGTYLFPVPKGAHIDRFLMEIEGRMTEAELLSADKAKGVYEEIVRSMKDPALLEYMGKDAFRVRIYPIEPRSSKRVKIVYKQLLKDDGGWVEYVYPMNTEKFSSTMIKQVEVKVSIHGELPLKTVYCGSHEVKVQRDSEVSAVIEYRANDERPDRDLRIGFSRKNEQVGVDLICSKKAGEAEGHFMLVGSPGFLENKQVQPKDICFVLDTSGSMAGKKLEQAKKALNFCLANLNAEDRFQVIRFSTEVEPVFDGLQKVGAETIERAQEEVKKFKPIGGTAIGEALGKALKMRSGDGVRPYLIVFMTDGLPTVGESREDALVGMVKGQNEAATRIYSFGIGHDVNVHLLDRVADETRGVSHYVGEKEDLELKLSQFYSKIKDPVFCHVQVEVLGGVKTRGMMPNVIPDLFQGDQLVLMGKYEGHGEAKVRVKGVWNGEEKVFESVVVFKDDSPNQESVSQLWATRRVGWILDQIRLNGESEELKQEVVELARKYGIVTPYTSYLILEDETKRGVPLARQNFSEMSRDARVVAENAAKMKALSSEAKMKEKRSGEDAVYNSAAVKGMQLNRDQGGIGKGGGGGKGFGLVKPVAESNVGYRHEMAQNYQNQAKLLNGRTFYQNGEVWVDSHAQSRAKWKEEKIEFNSEAYFALMSKDPNMAQWMSLGSNVDIVVGETLYQIREEKTEG